MQADPTLEYGRISAETEDCNFTVCVDINLSSDVTCGVLDGWVSLEGCENYRKIVATVWRKSFRSFFYNNYRYYSNYKHKLLY